MSIAGDRGPERRELERSAEAKAHPYDASDGEASAARGGRTVLWWSGGVFERRSLEARPDEGRECASLDEPSMDDAPEDSRLGEFWRVRMEESLVGREKDCSNGFGSRSRLLRRGLGGGRLSCCWSCSDGFWSATEPGAGGEAWLFGGEVVICGCTWAAADMTMATFLSLSCVDYDDDAGRVKQIGVQARSECSLVPRACVIATYGPYCKRRKRRGGLETEPPRLCIEWLP